MFGRQILFKLLGKQYKYLINISSIEEDRLQTIRAIFEPFIFIKILSRAGPSEDPIATPSIYL